jgi:PAT family beta-lactamase induction signal transducer AmpG
LTLRRKLQVIALMYVIEGYPMGIYIDVLQVWLGRIGVSTAALGYITGLKIAWSLKVIWSPLIDRFGLRRQWIAAANLAMGLALFVLSTRGADHLTAGIWLAASVYCLASATQDIAIDAYTIGFVADGEEGPANAMRMTGYRAGVWIAASVGLLLPRWIGWPATLATAAALQLVMAAAVYTTPRIEVPAEARREMWGALRRWFSRDGAIFVLLFVMLYRVGDVAMGPMLKPFWMARGYTNEEIHLVTVTFGIGATIAGAWLAGLLVMRLGIIRSLLFIGILALVSNLAYALVAAVPELGRAGVYAASLVESFCAGMAGVAFMSFLMRICDKEHAAVEYALLTSLYLIPGVVLGVPSGILAETIGYGGYFALTAAFALAAFALLPWAARWVGPEPD